MSKRIIYLIGIFWLTIIFTYKPWKNNLIINDVISYYAYLPATFIYKDISLKFTENTKEFEKKFWPEKAPNGGRVIKTTMGLSFLYAPFFIVGHFIAKLLAAPLDGFSLPYQVSILFGCLFYLMFGLWYLRKLLLQFFTEKIASITILLIYFGTGLLWYSSIDGLMSHSFIFSLLTFFIWLIVKWHQTPKIKTAIFIGLIGGLITLIRPTMIISFLIFVLYGVYNKQTFNEKLLQLKKNYLHIIIIAVCSFLIILPQLFYWKFVTGNWVFFSYVGERFYFDNPHIIKGLFGFRKGWLLYTPIMCFAIIGFFYVKKYLKSFMLPLFILLPIIIYVLFSWWAWWYGGCFGMRAMIDFYGFLALPLGAFLTFIFTEERKNIFKRGIVITIVFLCLLNLFQTWQYKNGLIHYDAMTKKSYMLGFFATYTTVEWQRALDEPNYERAKRGVPEEHSLEEINYIKSMDQIYFRAFNNYYLSADIYSTYQVTASKDYVKEWEVFSLVHLGNNKVAIKAANGLYWSADSSSNDVVFANRSEVNDWEKFEIIYLGNNRIALYAHNNRYVSVKNIPPYQMYAKSSVITEKEIFKIFIN